MLFAEKITAEPTALNMLIPLVVFLPILGLLINLIFGRKWNEKYIGTTASVASGLAFIVAVLQWYTFYSTNYATTIVKFADWITIGTLDVNWAFRIDTLSVTMMLVVSGIGTLIHVYAAGYMFYDVRYKDDVASYRRFFIYLNLFIAMMMILVTGDSYLMLFVGWEGVGLCSYLLIGFWFTRNPDGTIGDANSTAGKKAFVANRVGDFGFLIAMFLIFWSFGSLQFDAVFAGAESVHSALDPWVLPAIGFFVLLGVTGKSAQIPLYVWLPDAMAGPTPVSALIHAATMVTAGVYLVARSAPLFALSEVASSGVALVGGLTALFAATIAVGQFDIKKVLAYSTVSQLGFMVAAVGLGAYVAGIFHLVTHAFFKALLFLGSGSVILGVERGHHPLESTGDTEHGHGHGHGADHHEDEHGHDAHADTHDDHAFDPQDMRNMGGMRKTMPVTFWVYLIGAVALAGVPPLAGFWSKDEILADAAAHNGLVYLLLTMAAFLTAFYMGRQIWMVFFGEARTHAAAEAKESPRVMLAPLVVLAILSVGGGFLNIPGIKIGSFSWKGPHSLAHWLEYTLGEFAHVPDYINLQVAGLSTLFALIAIGLAWVLYGRKPMKAGELDPLEKILGPIFNELHNKWWVDEIYELLILKPYRRLAAFLADVVDWQFWHDWFHDSVIARGYQELAGFLARTFDLGVIDNVSRGLAVTTSTISGFLSKWQAGYVRGYALLVFAGVLVILSYLIIVF